MDSHIFLAGPNGLCEVCGLSRESCLKERQIWLSGGNQTDKSVNPAIVFYSQLPDTVKIQLMDCTKSNTFVLTRSGEVYSWGETTNALGRLLSKREEAGTPMPIELLTEPIVSLVCGDSHVLALSFTYQLYSWGLNKSGQLGLGHKEDKSTPQPITSLQSCAKVFAGPSSSYAVSAQGNLYVWGDNRNGQLGQMVDRTGSRKKEFVEPQEVYYVPWDKGSDIQIRHNKQGKAYFFKPDGDSSKKEASASKAELRKLEQENSTLRNQVQRLSERVAFLEEELSGHYSAKNPIWKGDALLDDMERLRKISEKGVKTLEGKMDAMTRQVEMLEADVKHLNDDIKSLEEKEADYWDELEHLENDLIRLQRDSHISSDSVKQQKKLRDDLQAQTNALSQSKAELTSLLSARETEKMDLELAKTDIERQLEDARKHGQVYDQMIYIRRKDLSAMMVEQSTESVEQDLIDLAVMHEALQETSISTISQSKDYSSLTSIIDQSTSLLTTIKTQIKQRFKREENPLQQHMNRVWEVLLDNADLRIKLNDYLMGIMEHTRQKLDEFYAKNGEFRRKEETAGRVRREIEGKRRKNRRNCC